MRFQATVDDPFLSQCYEYEIERETEAGVKHQAAEWALAADETSDKLSTHYKRALHVLDARDMVLANVRNYTTVRVLSRT